MHTSLPAEQKWTEEELAHGIVVVKLASWRYFHEYVIEEFLDFPSYVWRGQRKASWALQSSFDRVVREKDQATRNRKANGHLERFKMASRGRRGSSPARINDDSEWWALAQHNGMSTPLLDWTESPFVALYFAFDKECNDSPSESRAVWGLRDVRKKNREIAEAGEEQTNPLNIIRPMQDENVRLVSQAGLFTQLPPGMNVDDWIRSNYPPEETTVTLVKIEIPDDGRKECLRALNRMNINHLSLFPDLYGAGRHCDKALQISRYAGLVEPKQQSKAND